MRIDIFCDGSVTSTTLIDAMTPGATNDFIGRGMVVIPQLDFGLIAQTREGMTTAAGNPKSDAVEAFAISLAFAAAERLGVETFRICSDCQSVIERLNDRRVEWHSREEMRLPNDFFDTVVKRRPVAPYQTEIFELFNVGRLEFKLSESPLWERVRTHAVKSGKRVLGLAEAS
jgi:ribonuclease HI